MLTLPLNISTAPLKKLVQHANKNMKLPFRIELTGDGVGDIVYNYTERSMCFNMTPELGLIEQYKRFTFKLYFNEHRLTLDTGVDTYVCEIPPNEDTLVDTINSLEFACTWVLRDAMDKVIKLDAATLINNILHRCGVDLHSKRDLFDYINEINLRREEPHDVADLVTAIERGLKRMYPPRKFKGKDDSSQLIVIDFTPQTEGV